MMKFFIINALVFVSFFGCQSKQVNEANNTLSNTAVSEASSLNPIINTVIKENGWQIPMPEKKRLIRTMTVEAITENGKKVTVTRNDYVPVGEFYFSQEPMSNSNSADLFSGLLEINLITRLKVEDKTFSYVIHAWRTEPDKKTGKRETIGHPFLYQLWDSDGEGKFQIHQASSSKFIVPNWLAQ